MKGRAAEDGLFKGCGGVAVWREVMRNWHNVNGSSAVRVGATAGLYKCGGTRRAAKSGLHGTQQPTGGARQTHSGHESKEGEV